MGFIEREEDKWRERIGGRVFAGNNRRDGFGAKYKAGGFWRESIGGRVFAGNNRRDGFGAKS